MGTPCRRAFNMAIVEAELAGKTRYGGSPCTVNPAHVAKDGTTMRDTVKRTCLECEGRPILAKARVFDSSYQR